MNDLTGYFEILANISDQDEAIETIDEMISKYRRPNETGRNCAIDAEDGGHTVLIPRPVPYSLAHDVALYLGTSIDKAKWPEAPRNATVDVVNYSGDASDLMDAIGKSMPEGKGLPANATITGDGIQIECRRGATGCGIDTVIGYLDSKQIKYQARFA